MSGLGLDEIQIHRVLRAIQDLHPKNPVPYPAETWDVDIGAAPDRKKLGLAALYRDDSEAHARVGIAHLRILLLFDPRMRRHPVGDGIGWHLLLVHLQEGDLFAVRRPEVITAHAQFLGIHPVDFAVQDVFIGIVSELTPLEHSDRLRVEVVLAQVGDVLAVGRELGILAWVRRRRELDRDPVVEAVEPQLPLRIEQQVFRVGTPDVGRHVIAQHSLFFPFVLDLGRVRRKARQLGFADQDFLLSGGRVDVPQLAVLAPVIALHERQHLAVRAPLHGFRRTACQSALGENPFNGQRFLCGIGEILGEPGG